MFGNGWTIDVMDTESYTKKTQNNHTYELYGFEK
jgi:hypothetical protein